MCPNFNPRPRKEGDKGGKIQLSAKVISIHALVKRATSPLYGCDTAISISIHALVKRATMFKNHVIGAKDISIHALVKRAT